MGSDNVVNIIAGEAGRGEVGREKMALGRLMVKMLGLHFFFLFLLPKRPNSGGPSGVRGSEVVLGYITHSLSDVCQPSLSLSLSVSIYLVGCPFVIKTGTCRREICKELGQ